MISTYHVAEFLYQRVDLSLDLEYLPWQGSETRMSSITKKMSELFQKLLDLTRPSK